MQNFSSLTKIYFFAVPIFHPQIPNTLKNGENELLDLLQNDIEKYNSYGNIIIIGDLNNRIGEKQEGINFVSYFVDDTGDDHNILQTVDIRIRKALDVNSNLSGRKLLILMNECSLLTLNGRKLGDTAGFLTCHTDNGSSTVDLGITSWELYDRIQYFTVLHPVWFSAHCPVIFSMKTEQFMYEEKIDETEFIHLEEDFLWTPVGAQNFSEQLESVRVQNLFEKDVLSKFGSENCDPSVVTEKVESIFRNIAKGCLTPKKITTQKSKRTTDHNKWINHQCFSAKKDFINAKMNSLSSLQIWEEGLFS